MDNKKTIGSVLLVAGLVLFIVSLTADVIGIGSRAGFGYKQIMGVTAGVTVAMLGLFYALGNRP